MLEAEHRKELNDPEYVADWLSLQLSMKVARVMATEGLTRRAMAQKLGVSPAYVSKVLVGHSNLTLKSLAKFALALGMRPEITFVEPKEEGQAPVEAGGKPEGLAGFPRRGGKLISTEADRVAEPRAAYKARRLQRRRLARSTSASG
jgi:transcriptional regulator with XRE-family HTH domain